MHGQRVHAFVILTATANVLSTARPEYPAGGGVGRHLGPNRLAGSVHCRTRVFAVPMMESGISVHCNLSFLVKNEDEHLSCD